MKIAFILWSQFLFSHLIFVGLRYFMAVQSGTELAAYPLELPGQNGDMLPLIFFVIAAAEVMFGYLLPRFAKKAAPTVMGTVAPQVSPFKIPALYIIRLVTAEVASILGLCISIMKDNPHLLLPFAALGIAACLCYFPSKQHLDSLS